MKNSVTFIIRATSDERRLSRCLNSIYRQTNSSFKIIVITNVAEIDDDFKNKYPKLKFFNISKKKNFFKSANKRIPKIDTRYFMYVNSDTVLAPNSVDVILSHNENAVVFNTAKLNKNGGFHNIYPQNDSFNLTEYIITGVSIWNTAFDTKFVLDARVFLDGLKYFNQLMYQLKILSKAVDAKFIPEVLFYRADIIEKKDVTYDQFVKNRKLLKKIVDDFTARNMNDVRKVIVSEFVFNNIDEYYNEKNLFRRLAKRYMFSKYICL